MLDGDGVDSGLGAVVMAGEVSVGLQLRRTGFGIVGGQGVSARHRLRVGQIARLEIEDGLFGHFLVEGAADVRALARVSHVAVGGDDVHGIGGDLQVDHLVEVRQALRLDGQGEGVVADVAHACELLGFAGMIVLIAHDPGVGGGIHTQLGHHRGGLHQDGEHEVLGGHQFTVAEAHVVVQEDGVGLGAILVQAVALDLANHVGVDAVLLSLIPGDGAQAVQQLADVHVGGVVAPHLREEVAREAGYGAHGDMRTRLEVLAVIRQRRAGQQQRHGQQQGNQLFQHCHFLSFAHWQPLSVQGFWLPERQPARGLLNPAGRRACRCCAA